MVFGLDGDLVFVDLFELGVQGDGGVDWFGGAVVDCELGCERMVVGYVVHRVY